MIFLLLHKISDPAHPINSEIYKDIDPNLIPDSESLKDTYNRTVPYYLKILNHY